MSEDEQQKADRVQRWKDNESAQKEGKKILRRTARFYSFILGCLVGIYFDFAGGSENSIFGMIAGPLVLGGAAAFLITVLMFGIGL